MLPIPKQLIEFGLDLSLIKLFHSKTRLNYYTIESIEFVNIKSNSILFRLKMGLSKPVPNTSKKLYFIGEKRDMVIEISKWKLTRMKREIILDEILSVLK